MAPDMVAEAEVEARAEVMGAVEDGSTEPFILADVSRDGAYLTLPLEDAAALPAWR